MFADKNAANEGRLQLKRGSRDHQQHPNHGNYAGTGPEQEYRDNRSGQFYERRENGSHVPIATTATQNFTTSQGLFHGDTENNQMQYDNRGGRDEGYHSSE